MVVPVVLGGSTFDYRPLRSEQSRLAKTLVLPSPRDKDDTSQVMEIEDDPSIGGGAGAAPNPNRVPFKYPSYIKVRFDKANDLPIFELWTKDNFDQEHKISKESLDGGGTISAATVPNNYVNQAGGAAYDTTVANVGTTRTQINDNPLVGGNQHDGAINDSFAINPITGEIYRNAFWDHLNRVIKDSSGTIAGAVGFSGDLLGTVKFDGITGLALAAINTRIADISNAVEGVTKVLSVAIGNIDAVLNVVR